MTQEESQYQKYLELQRQIEVLEATVKQHCTKEAIARYGNLKAAHPEKAIQVITILAQLIQSGQLSEKITDEMFKNILLKLQQPRKEFKITKR